MPRIKFCHLIDASLANPLLYNSIKYSNREKFDYTVITLAPEGQLQEQLRQIGVASFSLNYTSKRKWLSTLYRLYRFFRKEKTGIVQVHGFTASPIGLWAAKLARVPVTIFSGHHSHEVPLYKKRFLLFFDAFNGKYLARHVISPSEIMKDIFIRKYRIPSRKIVVIHHGFDLGEWRKNGGSGTEVRNELGLDNKVVFGAVGRLFWVKDFTTLVKAFSIVAAQRPETILIIAGEGDERKNLEKLIADSGLSKKVILTGKRNDIAAVINSFDVFVHTALAESFGMVYIEVMALGKPVISTRVGVAPEIVKTGENGSLIETGNPEALASAMLDLIDKKNEWEKMGDRNRSIAEEFAVQKTQALCDMYYEKWTNQGK